MNKNRPVFSKNEIGRRSHELTAPTIMKETTESEAFQWLFNNAGDAVYVLDNQGKFVAVNQKVEEITELRREDYIGKSFRELIPAKNLPEAMKAHKNVLQGKSTMLNTKMKKAGGNVVPVEVTLAPLEKNNKIIGTLGIIRGVTERKKVEEELRQSEKRFHDVAANTGEWIWEVDAEGRYTYSSPMVERVLGYTAEEILGEFFYDFFHTDEREQLKSAAFKVFRRREPFTNFVNQNIHKDGYIVILETSGVPIIGPGGQFLGYRGVDRDITEQKRMEEDRKHFEEKLSALNIYSQQLNMAENMEEIYELTLSAMEKTLGFEHASFLIVDGNVLRIVDQRGYLTSLSMELLLDGSKGGVTVKAAKKGKAIYVPDVRMEKAFVKTVPGIRSELAVPMKIGGKVLGILNVERKKLNAFNKRDQRLLEILASHAATAISNFRYANNLKELIQEVEKRSSKLAALMKSSTEMMRTKDLRKRLKLIAETIKGLGWRRVVISDRDQNLKMIDMFTAGLAPEEVKILWTKKAPGHVWRERFGPKFQRFRIGEFYYLPWKDPWVREYVHGISSETPPEKMIEFIAGVPSKIPPERMIDWHPQDMLYAPLRLPGDGRIVGIISIDDPLDGRRPTKDSLGPLELFVHQAAVAIENARLIGDLETARNKLKEYADQLELKVEERTRELMKAEKLATIGELAASVGHDLRNPLMGMSGAVYYLKMKMASQMDEKSKEMLGLIESDIKYSNKIVSDLLDFSGNIRLHPTQIRVKSLMGKILSKIEVPKKVQILDLTGGSLKVFVDGIQMMRAFGNLITNAIEAMPKGGKLEIKSEKTKNCLKITFRDTGVGISRKNLRKLFTPLFTTKAKGIGMGLAICKRIISVHGGSIDVKSKEGAGTLVTVAIPLREEKDKHKK